MDFYGHSRRPLKSNLHTHSTTSDGFFAPAQIIDTYEMANYDVLFLTDHHKTNDAAAYTPRQIHVYSGIEVHPVGPRGVCWHILGLGIPLGFPGEFPNGQEAVDAINTAGGVAFAAHPYWCGFTSADVMSLRDIAGIEVYNTSTRYIGKAYNMQIWDEMLNAGSHVTALAVDDVHRNHDLFRGWTMICAEENRLESILTALRQGEFYATQGPEFRRLSFENGIFEAEFSEVEEAIILSNGSRGIPCCVPGDPFPNSHSSATTLRADVSKWAKGSYFRCQIRDKNGNYAWTNPLWI